MPHFSFACVGRAWPVPEGCFVEEDSNQTDLRAARGFGLHPDFGGPAMAAPGGARRGAHQCLDQGCCAKRCAASLVFPRPRKWPEFRARYIAELKHNPAVVELQDMASKSKTITLLFAAKDNLRNNATVLQEFLTGGAASK